MEAISSGNVTGLNTLKASMPEAETVQPTVTSSEEVSAPDFEAILGDVSQAEKEAAEGVHEKLHGKILKVKSYKILPPKTTEIKDGKRIAVKPKKAQKGESEFFETFDFGTTPTWSLCSGAFGRPTIG